MELSDVLLFEDREAFRAWLGSNADHAGVWLVFGKKGGPKTLSAAHALEEALCFGWIDGQMESLGATEYRKYFAPRRPKSNWSEKNRALVARLEADGRMTDMGRAKVDIAKATGTWDAPKGAPISPEDVAALREKLRPYELAHANFCAMAPSVQRTYTGWSMEPKTEQTRQRRLGQLIERLELGLNPMESRGNK